MQLDNVRLASLLTEWAQSKRWWPGTESGAEVYLLNDLSLVPEVTQARPNNEFSLSDGSASPLVRASIVVLRTAPNGMLIQMPITVIDAAAPWAKATTDQESIGAIDNWIIADGVTSPEFWAAWANEASLDSGDIDRNQLLLACERIRPLSVEQSNSSVVLEGAPASLIAKVFRVLSPGLHPEVELPSALGNWAGTAQLIAHAALPLPDLPSACGAVVTLMVADPVDGFEYFTQMASRGDDPSAEARRIGRVIAEMHTRLSRRLGRLEGQDNQELTARIRKETHRLHDLSSARNLPAQLVPHDVSSLAEALNDFLGQEDGPTAMELIRIHGDLHLGQLLKSGENRWVVVDFEGEPLRSLQERRKPDSPARDVAGMLRSFDYALAMSSSEDEAWRQKARKAFVDEYNQVLKDNGGDPLDERLQLLYEIEKALYELGYEAAYRPHLVSIPLNALHRATHPD